MPLFSSNKNNNRPPPAASRPADAAELSEALLVELRGQRADFQNTYALIESRLDKLEKAITNQPRVSDPAARPSPSDEETQYVLGDAESMEIIVNLGPLRAGRPLNVERRAVTPSSRRLWDQGGVDGDLVFSVPSTMGECVQPPRRGSLGLGRPLDAPSTPAGGADAKHTKQVAGPAPGAAAGALDTRKAVGDKQRVNAPSSYHWIIGADGAIREHGPPSPAPSPAPSPTPSQQPSQQLAAARGGAVPRTRPEPLARPPPPRDAQPKVPESTVSLGPKPISRIASSVCISITDFDDDQEPEAKPGQPPGKHPAAGPRPVEDVKKSIGEARKTVAGPAPKDSPGKAVPAPTKDVTAKNITAKDVSAKGVTTKDIPTKDAIVKDADAKVATAKDAPAVPAPMPRPASSICFSLEENEAEEAAREARRAVGPKVSLKLPGQAQGQAQGQAYTHGPYALRGPRGSARSSSASRLSWRSPPPGSQEQWRSGRSLPKPSAAEEGLRSCLRVAEYNGEPRQKPPSASGSRLRGLSPRRSPSRLGPKIKAWNRDKPLSRRRSRRGVKHDVLEDGAPRVATSRSSTRVPSDDDVAATAKSNIHLAKIYAQTDLALAAAMQAPPTPRRAPHPMLQHLPTCPRYEGRPPLADDKPLETLFTSRAAERALGRSAAWAARAHKDYLAQLSEYVRSISKGPGVATVIRNQLREPAPEKLHKRQPAHGAQGPGRPQRDASPLTPRSKTRDRPRLPDVATTPARHKGGDGTRTPRGPHRKDACSRDSRSVRHRGRYRVDIKDAGKDLPSIKSSSDVHVEPRRDSPGRPATQPNNTICSFICDYCRKLRQMM